MDDEEIRSPPTTHFIATVDDLTNMLDYDSGDIEGMDNDACEDQEPLPTGHWTTTSSYNIYMVDTPKENNGNDENPVKDKPPEIQPKHRRQRRHSKPRRSKNSNTVTEDDNTPDDAENIEDPVEPTSEH